MRAADENGKTALNLAMELGHTETEALIKRRLKAVPEQHVDQREFGGCKGAGQILAIF